MESKTGLKVAVKKVRAVAKWAWDVGDERDCGICRQAFNATCPTCRDPGEDCPPVFGRWEGSMSLLAPAFKFSRASLFFPQLQARVPYALYFKVGQQQGLGPDVPNVPPGMAV